MTKKEIFINKIYNQLNVNLSNESCIMNEKRNVLYTEISDSNKHDVLKYLDDHNIRHEQHLKNKFWIWIK